MTSDEIRGILPTDLSDRGWLKEIALQLALLNERQRVSDLSMTSPMPRRKVQ